MNFKLLLLCKLLLLSFTHLGDMFRVVYGSGTDDSVVNSGGDASGFNGFLITPMV